MYFGIIICCRSVSNAILLLHTYSNDQGCPRKKDSATELLFLQLLKMKPEGEEDCYQEVLKHLKSISCKLKDMAQNKDNTYHKSFILNHEETERGSLKSFNAVLKELPQSFKTTHNIVNYINYLD